MKLVHTFLLAAVLISALAGSASCWKNSNPVDGEKDSISNNSEGLVPLKVGNKWIFQFYSYDTAGSIITTFIDSFSVTRDTVIARERWYKSKGLKPADVDYLDWYTNRNNGIWVRRKHYDTSITYLTFQYPTSAGISWGNQIGDSTRTVSTDVIVETPTGVDTCIQYEDHFQLNSIDGIRNYYFFAPAKGWVMFDIYTSTNSGRLYLRNRQVLIRTVFR